MSFKFAGVGVALVTPFDNEGKLDFEALEKLIKHVSNNGVNYLVVMGTTGETPTLEKEEKIELLKKCIEFNKKKLPIVVGVGSNNTEHVIHDMAVFGECEIDGWLVVSPYYNKPSQEGIFRHFDTIAKATKKSIILYNVPGRTGGNLLPETAIRVAREHKHVVAIKEASGNFSQIMTLVRDKPQHFHILSGDDDLVLPSVALGMEGVISVAANCFTKDFCQLVNLSLDSKFEEARQYHYKLIKGIGLLFKEGNPSGVKYVLSKIGLVQNQLRLPLVSVSFDLKEEIDQELINILS